LTFDAHGFQIIGSVHADVRTRDGRKGWRSIEPRLKKKDSNRGIVIESLRASSKSTKVMLPSDGMIDMVTVGEDPVSKIIRLVKGGSTTAEDSSAEGVKGGAQVNPLVTRKGRSWR